MRRFRQQSYIRVPALTLLVASLAIGGGICDAHAEEMDLTQWEHPCKRSQSLHAIQSAAKTFQIDDRGYDVRIYTLHLTEISIDEGTIAGSVRIDATATIDGLSEFVVDLHNDYDLGEVLSQSHGVANVSHLTDAKVRVLLDQPANLGENIDVTIPYSGTPPTDDQTGFGPAFAFKEHGLEDEGTLAPMIYTLSVPDRSEEWWPCKDDLRDKAMIDISVRVPEIYFVASNGVLLGVDDEGDGTVTYNWRESHLIPTYLVSLAISNYDVFADTGRIAVDADSVDVPLPYYVYPEDRADAEYSFERVPEMVRHQSDTFGPYPFWDEKYGQAQIQWGGGAMEHQTCTSLSMSMIDSVNSTRPSEWIYVHELAHQWWGDWVSLADWRDVWLNEGFATYAEALWFEHLGGMDDYHAYVANEFDIFPPTAGRYVEFFLSGTVYDPSPLFGWTPYRKGALILHMLRHIVGDDDFFEIIRTYGERHGEPDGEVVETADFVAVAEEISGRSLDAFFTQWVYHPGRPHYRYEWGTTRAGGGYDVTLWISQLQTQYPVFEMPIDVLVETTGGDVLFTVSNNRREERFTLHVDDEPTAVVLDPENWVLKAVFPRRGISTLATLRAPAPNPAQGSSRITYVLGRESDVLLRLYDGQGRIVRTLVDAQKQAMEHAVVWDGRNDSGYRVASGIYFVKLETDCCEVDTRLVMTR